MTEENKTIDSIRNIEYLNLVFLYTDDASIILKYSKIIFSRLESLMSILSNVTDLDAKTYLPVGVTTALLGSLFEKLMKFYKEEIYKYVPENNENLTVFRSDTKVLRSYLMKIWIKLLSNECNNCIHELVLKSLSNSIKYLELDEMDQEELFIFCSSLINSDCYTIEMTAYTILDRFVNSKKNYKYVTYLHFLCYV